MNKKYLTNRRNFRHLRRLAVFLAVLGVISGGVLFIGHTRAANPTGGTMTTTGPVAPFTGTWLGTGTAPGGGLPQDEPTSCQEGINCDTFALTVPGTTADWLASGKKINVRLDWQLATTDYDMVVRKESGAAPGLQTTGNSIDPVVGSSGGSTNSEVVILSPGDDALDTTGNRIYYVRALYFAGTGPAQQYTGSASFVNVPVGLPPSACALPTFDNYQPPVGFPRRDTSGEPSVGVNWNTGNILAMSRFQANRATFNDSTSPANPLTVSWFPRSLTGVVVGADPILYTDPITGRTIAGELIAAGGTTQGGISDDDLTTFTATFQTGATNGTDHQTIGGGPPNPYVRDPVTSQIIRQPATAYPHLVYYASQQIAYAAIATSFDGGLTYDPAVPMWSLLQCTGLHGHIKVAPDGTVYVPNRNCNNKAAIAVSEDNGLNWSIRLIPTSSSEADDPSIGIGAGGRLYVGYTSSDKRPHVAVSDDKGLTWRDDYDLSIGIPGGLLASVFPAVVAGDNNRAAVFFIATNSPNTNSSDPTGTDGEEANSPNPDDPTDDFIGTWYPYIATTCDGGKTWSVVKADRDPLRPGVKNPAQQGVVCKNGTTCPGPDTGEPVDTRNLLDFNDITVDARGRIVVVYADGCISNNCVNLPDHSASRLGNDGTATLTLIRQNGGMRLFKEFDAGSPTAPRVSPFVDVKESAKGNVLLWGTPDDCGARIQRYRIYRGVIGQGEKLVAEIKAGSNTFVDRKAKRGGKVYYHVTAVNAYGESPLIVKAFVAKGD
jgi:hypothetical protein